MVASGFQYRLVSLLVILHQQEVYMQPAHFDITTTKQKVRFIFCMNVQQALVQMQAVKSGYKSQAPVAVVVAV